MTVSVVCLVLFGAVMVYSASSYTALTQTGNRYFYLQKQLIGAFLGFFAMTFLSFFDYRKLVKLRWILYGISILLLVLVFVPGIGIENYGARRWIKFPLFTIQSSEVAKFGYLVFAAAYMSKNPDKMTSFVGMLPVLVSGGFVFLLIMLEPNMSVTMCVALLTFALLFIGGVKIRHFVGIGLPAAAAVPVLILAEPYRLKRLTAFLNPWESPLAEGYQLIQSFYSLGSGGLFGLGLFHSRQKYLFLPFAESDFIFSIIGEELGFVGCFCVILLYVFIVSRAFSIAKKASDRFGGYLAYGIGCLIAIQVLINLAVVSGSIPPTGLPLPFVSAGTSSLLVYCASVGVLNSIHRFGDGY